MNTEKINVLPFSRAIHIDAGGSLICYVAICGNSGTNCVDIFKAAYLPDKKIDAWSIDRFHAIGTLGSDSYCVVGVFCIVYK